MNKLAHVEKVTPQKRSSVPLLVRTSDDARRVYVQSTRRIDLATIAKVFSDAPDCLEASGALPRR